MRDLENELIDELDGIAEDINPTPEPEAQVDTRTAVKKKGGTKK